MMTLARWKIIAIVASVVFGVLFTLPNFLPQSTLDQLPSYLPHKKLNLGLDLRGGSYLLLEVDTVALRRERTKNLVEDVRNLLKEKNIQAEGLGVVGNNVVVRVVKPEDVAKARSELTRFAQRSTGVSELNIVSRPNQTLELGFTDASLTEGSREAVRRSIEIIRKRIDPGGTKEIPVAPQGENRIVIQAPGESDPERLKSLIGRTAKLSFHMVNETADPAQVAQGIVPFDSEVVPSDDKYAPAYVLKKRALVSGEDLTNARGEFDQNNRPAVGFTFNAKGAQAFGRATQQNIGKRFAIVLDGRVISAPTIQSAILGGNGIITGSFTPQESADLANLLKSGALPAPLKVEDQRTVGAELGKDAIRAGAISLAIGAALIFAFIILAYGLFGLFAAAALVVNILLMAGAMSMTQATLTLPGIAGLILTLAVAVDANVLIYERIRDEARGEGDRPGRTPLAAADTGYRRALVSILDANVTTLISALIMLWLGQGPVRGFAWTLMVGVFTSLFTAILITQVLMAWWFRAAKPKTLPIL